MYAYANLKAPRNTDSGVAELLYLAPVSHFTEDGIKCPTAPFANPGDEVRVLNNHVFLEGKGFVEVQLAPDKNSLTASPIGDKGFKKLSIELTAVIPGSYAEVHEAIKNWMNVPLIVLTKDSNCPANMLYQLGCDCVYAWLEPTFTTGTTADGQKGYEVKITYSNGYVQLYAGTITKAGTPRAIEMAFSESLIATDAGVRATAVSLDADSRFQFTEVVGAVLPLTPSVMQLRIGADPLTSVEELTVEFGPEYRGKIFAYIDQAGVNHIGYFTPGYLTLF